MSDATKLLLAVVGATLVLGGLIVLNLALA